MPKTTFICATCKREFQAPKLVAETKNNSFWSSHSLKKSDISDVIKYGTFKKGIVIVCPKCQTFHT